MPLAGDAEAERPAVGDWKIVTVYSVAERACLDQMAAYQEHFLSSRPSTLSVSGMWVRNRR